MSIEVITSRQNRSVVRICKLNNKKNRDVDRLFRFDGIKLYGEAVSNKVDFDTVLLRESSENLLRERMIQMNIPMPESVTAKVLTLSDSLFDSISEEKSPDGIISVVKYIDKFHKIVKIESGNINNEEFLGSVEERIIILEDIRDPGNLGTILRSASALSIDKVLLCGDCADIYNTKTLRAAMGAIFKLPTVTYHDTSKMIIALRKQGRRVLAATLGDGAVSLGDFELKRSDCIAIGNEGHGLSRELIEACDGKIIIPMKVGNESLNAAAAAVVFMWELSRL